MLSTSRYPPAFNISPSLVIKLVTKNRATFVGTIRNTRSDRRLNTDSLQRHKLSSGSLIINLTTDNHAPCIINNLICTGTAKYGAVTVTYGRKSGVKRDTSLTVRPIPNPRILANSAELGTKAIRGLVLGVVSANTVIGVNGMCRGLVISIRRAGRGLIIHNRGVIVRTANYAHRHTVRTLTSTNNRMGATVISMLLNYSTRRTTMTLRQTENRIHTTIDNRRGDGTSIR